MNFLYLLTLSLTGSVTNGFLMMSNVNRVREYTRTKGLSRRESGFIHIGEKTVSPDVSIVILPGTLVSPDDYSPLGHQLKYMCDTKNITTDISIAQFTLNIGHRFEVDRVSKDILETTKSENIILVGHSASSAIGVDIASKVNASGLIQWCGTFNSRGTFPWETYDGNECKIPVLTILSEQDNLFSFAAALGDFDGFKNSKSMFSTYIKDANHMAGIGKTIEPGMKITKRMNSTMQRLNMDKSDFKDADRISISWRMTEFISHVHGTHSNKLDILNSHFWEKYEHLIESDVRPDVKSMLYGNSNTSVMHRHIHTPPDLILTIIYCSLPEIRPFVHFYTMLLPFIFSYGTSISISPLMNPLPGGGLNNPSIWVKIPSGKERNFSRDLNSRTFMETLSELSDEDREAYFKYGKQVAFVEDNFIPHVPGCGLLWLCLPLGVESKGEFITIKSPVIRMGDRLNTKIISKKQCLELILIKAFE